MTARALDLETGMLEDAERARACCIVVPTVAAPERLERCLRALGALDFAPSAVIVVDNSGGDDRTRSVTRRWGARYVVEGKRGVGRLLDRGTLASASDIIAYVDPRSAPAPGWLRALLAPFADPLVMAAAGSNVLGRTGILDQDPNRRVPTVGNLALRRSVFDRWPGFHNLDRRWSRVWSDMQRRALTDLQTRGYRVSLVSGAIAGALLPASAMERALESVETLLDRRSAKPVETAEARAASTSAVPHPPVEGSGGRLQRLAR